MKRIVLFVIFVVAAAAAAPVREAGTLIVFTLNVESSYEKNLERPAREKFDTLQWWIGAQGAWRIKTYSLDADIHPYRIDTASPKEELKKLAFENSKKHYGDVIRKTIVLEVPEGASNEAIAALLRKAGLKSAFEWVDSGYLLWLPDDSKYATKTKPQKG